MTRNVITILFGAIPSTVYSFTVLSAVVFSVYLSSNYWPLLLTATPLCMATLGLWKVGMSHKYSTIINLILVACGVFYWGRISLNSIINNPQALIPTDVFYILTIGPIFLFFLSVWYAIQISKTLLIENNREKIHQVDNQTYHLNNRSNTRNRLSIERHHRGRPTLSRALWDTWYFFKNSIPTIALIVLPIAIPLELISSLYTNFQVIEEFFSLEYLVTLALYFIGYPIYSVAIIYHIASKTYGRDYSIKHLWSLGIRLWIPFLVYLLLYSATITLGLILLVIPGILFTARLAFAEFELTLNDCNPLDAMRNSWESTRNYVWVILGGYLIIGIATYLPLYFASLFFDESTTPSLHFYEPFVLLIFSLVFSVLCTLFTFRVYENP
jgi:hypothetical protein